MFIGTDTLLGVSVFLLFCLISLTGINNFEAWSQVTLLWDSGRPLSDFVDHFHFERYLAAYPGLTLEALWPGVGFSIYISVFTAVNTVLFRRVHKAFVGMSPSLFSYFVFIMVHMMMNGRGAIGWCGWMICLSLYASYASMDRRELVVSMGRSLLILVSLLFASVSSGIFIAVFISITIMIFRLFMGSIRYFKLNRFPTLTFSFAVIGFVFYRAIYFTIDAIEKVLIFFGSYTEVIYHGLGVLNERFDLETLTIWGMILGATLLLIWRSCKNSVEPVAWQLIATAIMCGAFGFTTLSLVIPIALIFFNVPAKMLLRSLVAPRRTGLIHR